MKALFERHPRTSIIWAHMGLGRIIRPVPEQLALIDRGLSNPALSHVNIDISWDEVAKYLMATPEAVRATAALIERHADRFIFGTDVVAPANLGAMTDVYDKYAPLWAALTPETSRKVRIGNYERIFDEGRRRVRAWEKAQGY
jgi:predicted TIM-barrel fold metal-dependent hydrolase